MTIARITIATFIKRAVIRYIVRDDDVNTRVACKGNDLRM